MMADFGFESKQGCGYYLSRVEEAWNASVVSLGRKWIARRYSFVTIPKSRINDSLAASLHKVAGSCLSTNNRGTERSLIVIGLVTKRKLPSRPTQTRDELRKQPNFQNMRKLPAPPPLLLAIAHFGSPSTQCSSSSCEGRCR